jgi:hypothetical protein
VECKIRYGGIMATKKLYLAYSIIAILFTTTVASSLSFVPEPTHEIVKQVNCISCHAEEFNDLKTGTHIKQMGLAQNKTHYDYVNLYGNASDPAAINIDATCYTCHVTYENYNLFGLTDPYVSHSGQTNQTLGSTIISNAVYNANYGSIVEWPYPYSNVTEEINNASNATVTVQLQLLSIQPASGSLNSRIVLRLDNYSGQQTGNTLYQSPTQTLSQNQTLQTFTVYNMTNDYFNITLFLNESANFNNATLSLDLNGTDKGTEVFVINVSGAFNCNTGCAIYSIPQDLTNASYFKTSGAYKIVRLDAIWNLWQSYPVNGNITSSDIIQTSSPGGWISANTCSSRDAMCHINQEATFMGMSGGTDPDRSFYPHYMESITFKQCKICHLDTTLNFSSTPVPPPSVNGTISGTVTNTSSGFAISGANVTASNTTTTTDVNGRYSMIVAGGTYTMTADATGYQTNTITGVVVTLGNVTTQNFSLAPVVVPPPPNGTIVGIMTNASSGSAISGASVTAGNITTAADTNGSYSISIAAGTYTMTVNATGYLDNTTTGVVVTSGNLTTQNFSLAPLVVLPPPNGTIAGTITNASSGSAISGANVTADNMTATTDANGSYTMIIGAGTYTVTARAIGYLDNTTIGVAVTSNNVTTHNLSMTPTLTPVPSPTP